MLLFHLKENLFHLASGLHIGEYLINQPIKMLQRLCRIRRPDQQMGELLDEGDNEPQLMQLIGIGDLFACSIRHVHGIPYPDVGRFDADTDNVDMTQRQGGRQGIEKSRRILSFNLQSGRVGCGLIVNGDLYRE